MPGLDGLVFSRHVRERWPHIQVVVSSGRVRPERGELPEGAVFLPKPWTEESLVRHVSEAVDRAIALAARSSVSQESASPPVVVHSTNAELHRLSAATPAVSPDEVS